MSGDHLQVLCTHSKTEGYLGDNKSDQLYLMGILGRHKIGLEATGGHQFTQSRQTISSRDHGSTMKGYSQGKARKYRHRHFVTNKPLSPPSPMKSRAFMQFKLAVCMVWFMYAA
jgi:hypothetical protein